MLEDDEEEAFEGLYDDGHWEWSEHARQLIFISDEMSRRLLEEDAKIRTDRSGFIKAEFRENLEDLRLLVAKEYCNILLGIGEFSKYHHMRPKKGMSSLLKTDTLLFETFVRISIQITWLALGRKSFNQIELEVHRLFKSPEFNVIDHKISRRNIAKISLEERRVLLGHCVRRGKKVNTRSPLINEILCPRDIDYHMLGLGVAQYSWLLTSHEKEFADLGISLGIIGLPRWHFDTVLKEINVSILTTGSSASLKGSGTRLVSKTPRVGSKKGTVSAMPKKIYNDICIPKKEPLSILPKEFPNSLIKHHQDEVLIKQRLKWLKRVRKISCQRNYLKTIQQLTNYTK